MKGKILSITEAIPQPTTLPNGIYNGTWGAYVITIRYKDKTYEARTEEGVRGIGIKVVVTISDESMTFTATNN